MKSICLNKMNGTDPNSKKFKRPKQSTSSTTHPECSRPNTSCSKQNEGKRIPLCPLVAKDSEWVDINKPQTPGTSKYSHVSDEEEVLQLVECEDGPEMKPLAIMFPGLLERDPQTLEGVLNRAMSTTEVTRHLVDLGQKANFRFMKKANRLIPPDKQWLESVAENSHSYSEMESGYINSSLSSDYEDEDTAEGETNQPKKRRRMQRLRTKPSMLGEHDSADGGTRSTIAEENDHEVNESKEKP